MRLHKQSLTSATLLVVAFGLLRFVLALMVRVLAASQFGLADIDPYIAASRLPQVVGDFLVGGSFYFAVIPSLQDARERFGEQFAWRLARHVLVRAAVVLTCLSVAYVWLAGPALGLVAPDLAAPQRAAALEMCPVLSPLFLLMGLVLIAGGIIHSYRHFLAVALGSVLPALTTVGAMWLFGSSLGIRSWAWGIMVGTLLQGVVFIAILFVADRAVMGRGGGTWQGDGAGESEARAQCLRRMWYLVFAIGAGVLLGQVKVVVQSRFASGVSGGLALLDYSWGLVMTVFQLTVTPLIVALYPLVSEYAARRQQSLLRDTASVGLRTGWFVLIPVAFGMVAHSRDMVAIVLQHGAFSASDTAALAPIIVIHTMGLLAFFFLDVIKRMLCGMRDSSAFVVVSSVHAVAAWPVNAILFSLWQVAGLAVATALVNACAVAVGLAVLSRRGLCLITRGDLAAYGRTAAIGALAFAADRLCVAAFFPGGPGNPLGRALVGVPILLAVYLGVSKLLGCRELELIASRVARLWR